MFLLLVGLLLGYTCIGAVIAFDTTRVLAGIDRSSWCIADYRRELPNLLTLLFRAGLRAPWPARVSGFSIWRFKRRLRRLVREQPTCSPQVVDRHIGFWIYLQEHRDLLEFALCGVTAQMVLEFCQANPETDQEQYVALMRDSRERQSHLTAKIRRKFGPRYIADAQNIFVNLKKFQIVFNEHGFDVHDGFVRLRELEQTIEPLLPSAKR